jgi:hypothetical protein
MGRRHDESAELERAARTQDDPVEEDREDPRRDPDDNLIENPAPPASEEYVDLELARIQPPA